MSFLVNKIKKTTTVIKQLTLLFKSFKSLCEIIFYIFLMFYVGFDKIDTTNLRKISYKQLDYGVNPEVTSTVEKIKDYTFYVDPIAIIIILTLIVIIGFKINEMINVKKND